jgi:excisionase family DNA binding protein
MERKELLDVKQVAEWLHVKQSTIRKWVHYGFIPHVKISRCVRFQESEIERWVQERTEKGRSSLVPEIQWQ